MIIYPYKLGSRSAKRLKTAINAIADRKECWILHRPPNGRRAFIINWGASVIDYPEGQNWIVNSPADVATMSDKIKFFERTKNDEQVLSWTTDRSHAQEWCREHKVFVRHLTRGSGGRGIDVWSPERGEPLPSAPLYTRHQAKTHEYRVHLARSLTGTEFYPQLIQRKVWKKENAGAPKSWDVRSHDNGFIFQSYSDHTKVPAPVLTATQRVMGKYFPEMHFAALDVLYHQPSGRAVVCEGNTAPGLENSTVDVYAGYFAGLNEEFKKERIVRL